MTLTPESEVLQPTDRLSAIFVAECVLVCTLQSLSNWCRLFYALQSWRLASQLRLTVFVTEWQNSGSNIFCIAWYTFLMWCAIADPRGNYPQRRNRASLARAFHELSAIA